MTEQELKALLSILMDQDDYNVEEEEEEEQSAEELPEFNGNIAALRELFRVAINARDYNIAYNTILYADECGINLTPKAQ